MFARGSLVALVALVTLAMTAASAGAGASSTSTIASEPGDTFSIQGTDFQCGAATTGPRAMVCFIGSKQTARAHSYATSATDQGVLIFAATGSHQVVAKKLSPALPGPLLTGSSHKPTHYTLTKTQHVAVVGSHILCSSGTDANGYQTFACGLLTASEHSYWVPGTYGSVISDQGAYILLAGKSGSHAAVAFKKQP
jgi:hypothetical protein